MERKLLERMVGAAALVLALVVLVPALLDGNGSSRGGDPPSGPGEEAPMRTVTLDARGIASARQAPVTAGRPDPAVGAASPQILPLPVRTPANPTAPGAAPGTTVPGATAAPPVTRTPSVWPVPPPIEPKAAAEPRMADHPPTGGGWGVQLGVFGQRDNAERLVRDLRTRGFEASVSPMSRPGSTLYRVRVGPERDREAAEALAQRLAATGHRGPVVSM